MTAPEPFEAFPRAPLPLHWQRRRMLSVFASELRILLDPARRGTTFRLADLGMLPDESLTPLRPRLVEGCAVRAQAGAMWDVSRSQPLRLFAADAPARLVLDRIDGRTLGEIAVVLGEVTGWEPGRAFAYARGVFLHLVTLGVCRPG